MQEISSQSTNDFQAKSHAKTQVILQAKYHAVFLLNCSPAREGQPRAGDEDSDDDDDLPPRRQTREEVLCEGKMERETVLEWFFPER